MGFEGLFMWGLGCIQAEFLLMQFPMHLGGFFFPTKRMSWGGGLGEKKRNFFIAIYD
jgi:hypothetical protein